MEKGDAFVIDDEDGTQEHLHVVLTEPSLAGEVVTVSVSTRKRFSELLTFIQIGEHPWITRESIVPFRYAAIRSCATIQAAIANGSARTKEKASPALIRKMRGGLVESEFTQPEVKSFYKAMLRAESAAAAAAAAALAATAASQGAPLATPASATSESQKLESEESQQTS